MDVTYETINDPKTVAAKNERVRELRDINRLQWVERCRVRDILNNRDALVALLGKSIKDKSQRLPIANLMLRADTVLGQKLGRRPDVKVDPPAIDDSDLAHKRADKRARAVEWLDDECALAALLPQVGRWVPGYGFTAGVVKQGWSRSRQPVPIIELRDPIQTFPGEWGTSQQPIDMAVCHVIGRRKLAAMYPDQAKAIMAGAQGGYATGVGGAVMLDQPAGRSASVGWANQSGAGVEVYEYYDERGCWWLVPECNLLLSYMPNVVADDVAFRIVKRFTFDEVSGAYDAAIGVLANAARLALLATLAVEDGVNAETNVVGDLIGDEYHRGRNSVNYLRPGSAVEKMNSRVPFETFSQQDRIERQLRLIAGHSVADDGESPNSFVTGRGLQELASSGAVELREYQMSFERWLRSFDSLRLQYMEVAYPDTVFRINGVRAGAPFAETFVPAKDIKGDYVTRRVYGAMAGFDDATKIITGLQLKQGKIIDSDTLREQVDGLENHEKIKERIRAEEAETIAFSVMEAMAQQGDRTVLDAMIKMLPTGQMRTTLEEVFAAQDAAQQQAPPAPAPAPGGAVPDVMTVLSRLGSNGQASAHTTTVGQVA